MTNVAKEPGFELRELRLCGGDVAPAQLCFKSGLNVIEGASDTGKSFAVSCIDFVLGAKAHPEEIPEAKSYNAAYLWLQSCDGRNFTLKRALAGGPVALFRGSLSEAMAASAIWETRHIKSTAKNSLSKFLLELCGLGGKRVRSNAQGKTCEASFRTLSKALIVDEERIIAKRSPMRGTQQTGDTSSASTLRLLLTGHDDSAIPEPEDKKVAAGRIAGKRQILEALLQRDEETLVGLLGEHRDEQPVQSLNGLEMALQDLARISSAALADLQVAEADRRASWVSEREHSARAEELDGMLARARLLDQHYASDIRRLEAIAEAANVLQHYSEQPCRYCGADPEHQQRVATDDLGRSMSAAAAEALKVRRLKHELSQAAGQIERELLGVNGTLAALRTDIEEKSAQITEVLAPKVRSSSRQLQALQAEYRRLVSSAELASRITALKEELREVAQPATAEKLEFLELTGEVMAGVCLEIEALLNQWCLSASSALGFDKVSAVVFDERSADILIGGRRRTSHGKGVRAVTCAAFVTGVMLHCKSKGLGHPGFVVIDTPLNPYKPADDDDGGRLGESVKYAFYRSLCSKTQGQVIIFENEPPPKDTQAKCNYVHFSKTQQGRYGFIPAR